ncbi:hypothetical protein GCM10028806_35340 [Spirosoma terrae]|uniref:Peptidase M64 n=1 Tax=Spirosoma terrae TaxID=1968276 RepID=A0A6L9LAB0_9BACT|nr:M64 family metallopeptidase [Spirosoma terrae]NDU97515.1 peptidase M64 [Spirosoma terrae]
MKTIALVWLIVQLPAYLLAQSDFVFPVDTLVKTGPISNRINICLLPDGYQASEMTKFRSDAQLFVNSLQSSAPFTQYKAYLNVFLIRVPSNQSGASHAGTASDEPFGQPIETIDNYFGSQFDTYGIHRLVTVNNYTRVTNVLATNLPDYDMVVVLVNSPYYGGSGGGISVATTHPSSGEIAIHEIGHSFVSLADEYWAGPQYASERLNMTQNPNPASIRWKDWLNAPPIGIFQHPVAGWYKPTSYNCKMEALGLPFCAVCREGFTNRILDLVHPVDEVLPHNDAPLTLTIPTKFSIKTVRPDPNTLHIDWLLNGQLIDQQNEMVTLDPAALQAGQTYQLSARILDTTAFIRSTDHANLHRQTVNWTIQRGCLVNISQRAGDWHDPTLWSCGSVPTSTSQVIIAHKVRISIADASAYQVRFEGDGHINYVEPRRLWLAN